MAWGAIIGAAINYFGNKNATDNATDASKKGNEAAIDEQRRQYDQTRQDLLPYMQWGGSAIPLLQQLNAGDYSGFMNAPDYQAALQQGQGQIDSSAAARGGLFGGGHTRDSIAFGSGLASQYLNNYRNSLFQQAGSGQNAAAGLGGLGASMANRIGSAYQNIGDTNAAGYLQNGNNLAGLIGAAGNAFSQWYGNRQTSQPTSSPSAGWSTGFGNNTGWLSDGSYGGGYYG